MITGVVDFKPEDQTVVVLAGTSMAELQRALEEKKQCIPLLDWYDGWNLSYSGSVAGNIALNVPHELEAECGTWRDWVLGMTVVLADGSIVKSGSRAVKNVAGYDAHKLFIGSRGTLGLILEVVLRTFPIASLPEPNVVQHILPQGFADPSTLWIQRTLPSDFVDASARTAVYGGFDYVNSSVLFRIVPPEVELPRYRGDWVMRRGCGSKNLEITDPTLVRAMKRTKYIFDPTNKMNPGEFGVV